MADTTLSVDVDTKQANSALEGLKAAFLGLISIATLKALADFSDGITNINNRIKSLAPDLDAANKNFDAIVGIAISARAPLSDVAGLFTKLQVTTRDLGISTRDVARITETLTKAMAISGTSTVEAQSAMYQFNQALALGVFQGNDLHSMLQTMPKIMQGFADSIGVPLGALRDLGSTGSITAQMVVKYLKGISDQVDKDFANLSPTFAGSFNTLKTSASVAFNEFEKNTQTGQNLALSIEYIAMQIYKLSKNVDAVVTPLRYLVEIGLALLAFTAVGRIFEAIGGAIAGVGAAATNTVTAARGLMTTFEATWQLISKFVQGLLPSFQIFIQALGTRFGYLTSQVGALTASLTTLGAGVLAFLGLDKFFDKFSKKEEIASVKEELANFRKEMADAAKQTEDSAKADALKTYQQEKVKYATSLATLASRQQTDVLKDNLDRVKDKLKFDAEQIILAGEFTNKSKDQIEIDTALRDLNYEKLDSIRKLTQEQEKLRKELTNPELLQGENAGNQVKIIQNRIAVIGQQIVKERELYDQQAKSLPSYITALQSAKLLEENRRITTEQTIKQIEEQIAQSQKLGDSLRSISDQKISIDFEAGQRGRGNVEKQIETIKENARKAALEAGRAFSQAFADTGDGLTPERAQELEKGLQKITDGYKKIADQQVNNLKASREWDTGWKEAFANYTENAQNAAEQARTYFETFTKGFEDALVKFVETGKLSFKDLANSIIADFIRIQVRQQLSSQTGLLAGLFSFGKSLFGLAAGGPTNANQPYIVGEQGPELFVPRTAGTIVPNNQLSSAAPMVTNVSYSISAVDASSFRQLVAQDPQFIYNITEVGRRSVPSRRLA